MLNSSDEILSFVVVTGVFLSILRPSSWVFSSLWWPSSGVFHAFFVRRGVEPCRKVFSWRRGAREKATDHLASFIFGFWVTLWKPGLPAGSSVLLLSESQLVRSAFSEVSD